MLTYALMHAESEYGALVLAVLQHYPPPGTGKLKHLLLPSWDSPSLGLRRVWQQLLILNTQRFGDQCYFGR